MTRQEEIAAWQKRLEATFSTNGIVGGRLLTSVLALEQQSGTTFVTTFKGYRVLIDAFFEFFAESLEKTILEIRTIGYPKDDTYSSILLEFQLIFRAFRAAESLACNGYPLDGYALLRNLAERVVVIASLIHGISTLEKVIGTDEAPKDRKWTLDDKQQIRRRRKREERRIFDLMTGRKSGLSPDAVKELELWNSMFDMQVHGSQLSKFGEVGRWMFEKEAPFSLGPQYDEDGAAMYFNRSTEIAWLIVRVLPYLQQKSRSFGMDWERKWQIMDDSFRFSVESLGLLGKKIAAVMIELVEAKFSFTPAIHYVEPRLEPKLGQ
jgi:hypothetical protein